MREESSTEWHSGNNLLNLLLHLPEAATRPDLHPVARSEKATKDAQTEMTGLKIVKRSESLTRESVCNPSVSCVHAVN